MPRRSSKKGTGKEDQKRFEQAASEPAAAPVQNDPQTTNGKNPAAVALGRLGGKKGGIARAMRLTAEQRREIAKKAAEVRWRKKKS